MAEETKVLNEKPAPREGYGVILVKANIPDKDGKEHPYGYYAEVPVTRATLEAFSNQTNEDGSPRFKDSDNPELTGIWKHVYDSVKLVANREARQEINKLVEGPDAQINKIVKKLMASNPKLSESKARLLAQAAMSEDE